MVQQDLLPSNKVARNEAKQWLSSEDCAHASLLHKDTLGPACWNLFD